MQRRSQFVGHVGQELGLRHIGGLGLAACGLQRLFAAHAIGHIARNAAKDFPVAPTASRPRRLDGNRRPLPGDQRHRAHDRLGRHQRLGEEVQRFFLPVGGMQVRHWHVAHLLDRITQPLPDQAVDVEDPPVVIENEGEVVHRIEQRLEIGLGLSQALLGRQTRDRLADVAGESLDRVTRPKRDLPVATRAQIDRANQLTVVVDGHDCPGRHALATDRLVERSRQTLLLRIGRFARHGQTRQGELGMKTARGLHEFGTQTSVGDHVQTAVLVGQIDARAVHLGYFHGDVQARMKRRVEIADRAERHA